MYQHLLHLRVLSLIVLLLASMASCFEPRQAMAADAPQPAPWPGKKSKWHGYDRYDFDAAGRPCYVVVPKEMAAGRPWVWRTSFPDFHAEADIALLGKGVLIAHLSTSDLLGSPRAVAEGEKFYELLTKKHGLSRKVVLEGVSRGGLLAYNFAIKHPDQVACIYCDTPVLDFKSWPGGKGKGVGSRGDWATVPKHYNMSEAEAMKYPGNPVDNAAPLAAAKIPILHIVAEDDKVVPPAENTYLLKQRLEKLGHTIDVISVPQGTKESQGHHFTHPDPPRVVEFILKHTK